MTEQERLRADNERLTGDVQRLTETARTRAVREAITDLSPRLGISNPKLAARLLDTKDLEFTDEGEPKGKTLETRLEALKGEYPEIATRRRGSSDAGAGREAGPNESDISARIRERLRPGG